MTPRDQNGPATPAGSPSRRALALARGDRFRAEKTATAGSHKDTEGQREKPGGFLCALSVLPVPLCDAFFSA